MFIQYCLLFQSQVIQSRPNTVIVCVDIGLPHVHKIMRLSWIYMYSNSASPIGRTKPKDLNKIKRV